MTKPKMVRCEGSGQIVFGEDEPDGTVYCSRCGTSFLRMVTTTLPNGKNQLSVSIHERRASPPRVKRLYHPQRKAGSIIPVMNAYVNYFDSDGARARAATKANDIRDDEFVVQYSSSPDHWKMSRWEAQSNCDILNRANVCAKNWPEHHCNFEIEEVGTDEYAIVCKTHPQFTV